MAWLSLRDAELYVEESGAGPPLVLLHGLGGSGADWEPTVAAFHDRFRVVRVDLRGCGRTRDLLHPHGPFTLPQLSADVVAVLGQLRAGPAHLLGWSLGGMIALQLAVDAPQLVRSLCLVNTGPDWTPKTPLQRLALRLRGSVTTLLGPGPMARVVAPRLFPGRDQEALRRRYIERLAGSDKGSYAALLEAILGWSVADRLGSISCPTLVVASEGDYTSVASKEAWARQMPDARLAVVPQSRHALPLEAPDRLHALVAGFLDPLPRDLN
jgi:pimeloyl-ACP methyl ester carboxylesterase